MRSYRTIKHVTSGDGSVSTLDLTSITHRITALHIQPENPGNVQMRVGGTDFDWTSQLDNITLDGPFDTSDSIEFQDADGATQENVNVIVQIKIS